MEITIEYKMLNDSEIKKITLTPSAYFDELEYNENFEEDGVQKHQDPKKYLEENIESKHLNNIEFIKETIVINLIPTKTITTHYFANGQSIMINRKDINGYESIIQSFKIANNCVLTSKIERNNHSDKWLIQSSIGLNYEETHVGNEKWYSPLKGEFLDTTITISK